MSKIKALYEVLGRDDTQKETYLSEQKKREKRAQKGWYSRKKGLFNFLQLIKAWEEIVGNFMAQNTIPMKIKNKTLIISAKHPIFAQELGFLAPQIILKIKNSFPDLDDEIRNIKFVHNDFSSEQFLKSEKNKNSDKKILRPSIHPFSPEFRQKKANAQIIFSDIEDEELKNQLINFYLYN